MTFVSTQPPSRSTLIPTPLLFHYTFPVMRVDALPRKKAPLLTLPEKCRVVPPSAMDQSPFAVLKLAWNPHGLAVEIAVSGKCRPPRCRPESIESSDAVHLWIDTRDTQTIHRASRFCHYFVAMPCGSGIKGTAPWIRQFPVARAREDAPRVDPDQLLLEGECTKTGYRLGVWLPREALHGFDTETQRRLGFNAAVHDHELGLQVLTVGDEFPIDADPSLWSSLELADD